MKHLNISLGAGDVEAISCALSVLPDYESYDDFPLSIASLVPGILFKLNDHKSLSGREFRLVAISIDLAYKALRGEISVEQEALSELRPHFFTINKLYPQFSVLLDSDS